MNHPIISQIPSFNIEQQTQLHVSTAMRQAFHVMSLPVLELAEWLNSAIESNPILEIDYTKEQFKESLSAPSDYESRGSQGIRDRAQEQALNEQKNHFDQLLTSPSTLQDHLLHQLSMQIKSVSDRKVIEQIIGHLDERGFLSTPTEEIAPAFPISQVKGWIEQIQTLDPPGIGGRDLVDSLLIQLRINKGSRNALHLISFHFEDLLHNRLPLIAKAMGISESMISQIVEDEIALLDTHPGYRFLTHFQAPLTADIHIHQIEEKWHVEVNTSYLPHFHISPLYMKTESGELKTQEESSYVKHCLAGGKWLKRIVNQRNTTLKRIATLLLHTQQGFFEGEHSHLIPMTMQEAAQILNLHESTVARAVCSKYITSPQGLFPLRHFFSQGIEANNGEKVSSHTLKEMLERIIAGEDKQKPLSDLQISVKFRTLGLPCARRTVTKYREAMRIGPALRRKRWCIPKFSQKSNLS